MSDQSSSTLPEEQSTPEQISSSEESTVTSEEVSTTSEEAPTTTASADAPTTSADTTDPGTTNSITTTPSYPLDPCAEFDYSCSKCVSQAQCYLCEDTGYCRSIDKISDDPYCMIKLSSENQCSISNWSTRYMRTAKLWEFTVVVLLFCVIVALIIKCATRSSRSREAIDSTPRPPTSPRNYLPQQPVVLVPQQQPYGQQQQPPIFFAPNNTYQAQPAVVPGVPPPPQQPVTNPMM